MKLSSHQRTQRLSGSNKKNIAIKYDIPTESPLKEGFGRYGIRQASTKTEVIISSGHPVIRPYHFEHRPISVLRQHFPPLKPRPYKENSGFKIDQPLTGAFVIGGLFLLVIVILVIAAIIFSKKKNTVFAYQKSSRDDEDFSLELDDFASSDFDDIEDSILMEESCLDRVNRTTSYVKWHPTGRTYHTVGQNINNNSSAAISRNNFHSLLNYVRTMRPHARMTNEQLLNQSAYYSVRQNKLKLTKSYSCQTSFNYDPSLDPNQEWEDSKDSIEMLPSGNDRDESKIDPNNSITLPDSNIPTDLLQDVNLDASDNIWSSFVVSNSSGS